MGAGSESVHIVTNEWSSADLCPSEDAIGALTHASAYEPGDKAIGTMLQSLKAVVAEQKKDSENQMTEGEGSLRRWFESVMAHRGRGIQPLDEHVTVV